MEGEQQYLDLARDVLENGVVEEGRNGNTISVFGRMMRFSLKDGNMPILTTKQVAWKTCFKELMWFVNGRTDNAELRDEGVHIWDANATREFLDSRGLTDYPEGLLGPIYGYQWRHFGAPYVYGDDIPYYGGTTKVLDLAETPPPHAGIDQLQQIVAALSDPKQRYSRRLIMTAWNPAQLDQMALPPCHVLAQFSVKGSQLSCALYQRSGDIGLGIPFNIASYSFLTHILAKHCGLEAGEFVHFLGDAHVYLEHVDGIKEQLGRQPLAFPKIRIAQRRDKIEEYSLDDLVFVEEYKHHPKIVLPLVA
jgi:thymidylate synthase